MRYFYVSPYLNVRNSFKISLLRLFKNYKVILNPNIPERLYKISLYINMFNICTYSRYVYQIISIYKMRDERKWWYRKIVKKNGFKKTRPIQFNFVVCTIKTVNSPY